MADFIHDYLTRLEALADWRGVRLVADAYLRRDELDETVAAAAIRADVAIGNTGEAYRRFLILREVMKRELGIEPGPVVRDALSGTGEGETPQARKDDAVQATIPFAASDGHVSMPPLVVVTQFGESGHHGDANGMAATIREEVVSGLSRFGDLRVITDPRPFDALDGQDFDRMSGAYALGAGLRTSKEGVRLTVRLKRLEDLRIIWSESASTPDIEMVDTIDNIIAKTIGGVLPKINADLLRRPSNLPVDTIYRRYLVAREAAMTASSFADAQVAARNLESMIRQHPNFALPYLPLAYLYNTDFHCTRAGSSGEPEFARALELAKRALAVDRDLGHAYTVAGWCYLRRRSWLSARRHLEQGLERNPFHATRVMEVGYGFLFLGELDLAETLLDRCLLLNPAPHDGFFQDLGLLSLLRGDHDKAASFFELIAAPGVWELLFAAANCELGGFGNLEQARQAVAAIRRVWPEDRPMRTQDVLDWADLHLPLQVEQMRSRLLRGIGHALSRGEV